MIALPSVEDLSIKSGPGLIRGAAVLEICKDALRDEADRIRQSQDALITAGHLAAWDDGRARAHHVISAVAEVVDRWLSSAKASEGAKQPHALVLDSADVARSVLISEITKLQSKSPAGEPEDVVA